MEKEYIKKVYKIFLFLLPLYIAIISLSIIRLDYYVYVPGNTSNVETEIKVNDKKLNGSVSSIYVVDASKPTVFEYLFAKANKSSALIKMSKTQAISYDNKLEMAIGVFDSMEAYDTATLASYQLLNPNDTDFYTNIVYIYSADKDIDANMNYLNIVGKAIKSFGSNESNFPSIEEITNYLKNNTSASLLLVDENNRESTLNINRNSETGYYGITIKSSFKINKTIDQEILDTYTIGPSGGAMQTLFMYLKNSDTDYLKGRNIAGTGTVYATSSNENVSFTNIGSIGCVGQKLMAAYLDNIDIFYCPEGNYDECMEYYNKYGFKESDIRVVKVSVIEDILKDLLND